MRKEVTGMVGAKVDGRGATLDAVQAIVRRLSIIVESKDFGQSEAVGYSPLSQNVWKTEGRRKVKRDVSRRYEICLVLSTFLSEPFLNLVELQQTYNRMQGEMQAIAQKIGELESEAEEHEWVLVPSCVACA